MASEVETPLSLSKTDNPSSEDMLSEGIMMLMRPSIEHLDVKVHKVRKSQAELSSTIDIVSDELRGIADNMPTPSHLDPHIKRLGNARRKVNIINSILHNCQERLRKLHTHIGKETQRREQSLQRKQQQSSATQQSTAPSELITKQTVTVSNDQPEVENPQGKPNEVKQEQITSVAEGQSTNEEPTPNTDTVQSALSLEQPVTHQQGSEVQPENKQTEAK